jgi:DNA-binding response OmpR family regulator
VISYLAEHHPFIEKLEFMASVSKAKSKVAKKILIVEDEGQIGLALDMILSDRNFHVDYASSLLAASEYLEKNKPSVVILDNKLPDGFGVDFISYIKKKYPRIKIIMISGFPTVRDVAMNNGADMFLEKPFSMDNVNAAIDSVLK